MLVLFGVAVSTAELLGGVFILYVGYCVVNRFSYNAKVRQLGARAPARRTYLPLSLDLLYSVIKASRNDAVYEFWLSTFKKYAPETYTIETGVGERVIMTADPENIKAILATQFKDYGKGEQFHKDWEMFLGDGKTHICGCGMSLLAEIEC